MKISAGNFLTVGTAIAGTYAAVYGFAQKRHKGRRGDGRCLFIRNGRAGSGAGAAFRPGQKPAAAAPGYHYTGTEPARKKKILIVGKGSYIGEQVREYLTAASPECYVVDMIGAVGLTPSADHFAGYDVVLNAAGIAHRKETNENRALYYEVNRDLAVNIAEAAKAAGAGQLILLSSMAVYGMTTGYISKDAVPYPDSAYGESKLSADEAAVELADENFKVVVLRPPMVYGKGCRGNYQALRAFALKSPVFPSCRNERSMIYIGNLCEFVKRMIDEESGGLYFPQDAEYVGTARMVRAAAQLNGRKVRLSSLFNPVVKAVPLNTVRKVFGSLTYEKTDLVGRFSFKEGMALTEGCPQGARGNYAPRRKQALCIASVASNLDNFNRSNVEILQELGYEVTLAANFRSAEDINPQEKTDAFAKEMRAQGVHIVQIDFARSLKKAGMHVKSAVQAWKLLKRNFDLVHCHSPICAAVVRAAARPYRKKHGTKVMYTAHGFHFYDGAPKRNWLLFYPVEKLMSRYTDVLVTINKEDYRRAQRKFHAGKTVYVPGTGVDTEKFRKARSSRDQKRRELGIKDNDILFLSAGELNENKNHELAVRAFADLKNRGKITPDVKYFICGIGRLGKYLEEIIRGLGLEENIQLLGYRTDMAEIIGCADIFLFMSKREGLPAALMEGMAGGLPAVVTRTRGSTDLIEDGVNGYVTGFDAESVSAAAGRLLDNENIREAMRIHTEKKIRNYDLAVIRKKMRALYAKTEGK